MRWLRARKERARLRAEAEKDTRRLDQLSKQAVSVYAKRTGGMLLIWTKAGPRTLREAIDEATREGLGDSNL